MKRQVFYSFHYANDSWRVQQIRHIGVFDGSPLLSANKWEEIKRTGESNVKKWINDNLRMRSCTIVLIGEETSNRKWVKYEIEQSWRMGKGVVGLYIHNLKDSNGKGSNKGKNPFRGIIIDGVDLEAVVPVYDPPDTIYSSAYLNIQNNIEGLVENGISIRNAYESQKSLVASKPVTCDNSNIVTALATASVVILAGLAVYAYLNKRHDGATAYHCPFCGTLVPAKNSRCPVCHSYLKYR
ncbi:TIR domain-containing protein [Methanorbis rubei]|uniref:Thoeris protein ThsB TIR-like domain-containing protein n=1 Tax=Methanorbis rubei TaxID=3028300 RepID=A0AAE4SBU2_9EURY|nr:hypothetical protein [Methanocorpusculaceae archaeon Cs1]